MSASPGFNPRPSLSERNAAGGRRHVRGVAGVQPPAFVERCGGLVVAGGNAARVAGVQPPLPSLGGVDERLRHLNHFPRVRPVSFPAALRPMRFPTLPFFTAFTSPMSLATE